MRNKIQTALLSYGEQSQDNALISSGDIVNSIDFSIDGTKCVSGSDYGTLRLWDVISETCLRIYETQRLPVNSVQFSPLNDYIASGDHDGNLELWSIKHNSCIRTIDAYKDGMGVCSQYLT
ncbi:MAG: WD40 repeat domain-containing protein [Candidatus Xenobiia bacterium LiM19]